jgi:hypothetical protein
VRVPGLIARPRERRRVGAMIPSLSRVFYQRQWQKLNENNEPSGARQNMLEFAARLSVSWTRGPRRVRPGRRPREAPLMHVAKEDLRAPPVYSPSALGKRAHGGLARRRLATAKVSVDIDGVPKGARVPAHGVSFAKREPRPRTRGAGSRRAARNPALVSAMPPSFL